MDAPPLALAGRPRRRLRLARAVRRLAGDLRLLGLSVARGDPRIPAGRLESALDEKIAAATAQGLRVHIVSQFSFSPERILAWLKKLRACGIGKPVKIGMAGPTSVPALLRYAKRCGVAASLRGLASGVVSGLVGNVGPDPIIETVSAAGGLGDVAPHYFSFGGTLETARYACEAAAGRHGAGCAMARSN